MGSQWCARRAGVPFVTTFQAMSEHVSQLASCPIWDRRIAARFRIRCARYHNTFRNIGFNNSKRSTRGCGPPKAIATIEQINMSIWSLLHGTVFNTHTHTHFDEKAPSTRSRLRAHSSNLMALSQKVNNLSDSFSHNHITCVFVGVRCVRRVRVQECVNIVCVNFVFVGRRQRRSLRTTCGLLQSVLHRHRIRFQPSNLSAGWT